MTLILLFDMLARQQVRLRRCGDDFALRVQPSVDRETWAAYVKQNKQELLHILDLVEQAYPEGVPAKVPYEPCLLCSWRYPAVWCRFRDGSEGFLCVGCVVAESRPNVNRAQCEICEQPLDGGYYRTDPGGPVVCSGCWRKYTSR